jgi:hypothetical protein
MPASRNKQQQKFTELQQQYDLLSEKLTFLRKSAIIENDASTKFKLQKEIEQLEAQRSALENQLQLLEQENQQPDRLLTTATGAESVVALPQTRRKRWLFAALFSLSITLLIVIGLVFIRVPQTGIELDLALTRVEFILAEPKILTDIITLPALGVSELRDLQLPPARDRAAQVVNLPDGKVYFAVESNPNSPGMITLAELGILPAGTRIEVSHTDVLNQYRIALEAPQSYQLNVELTVQGTVNVTLGAPAEQMNFDKLRRIEMHAVANRVTLDLSLPEATPTVFKPQLPIERLALIHLAQITPDASPESSIRSGKVAFTEVKGPEYSLQAGEWLRFKESRGVLQSLTFANDQLMLKFQGYVRGMTAGSKENRTNLMPTYLAWLWARL